MVKKPLKHGFRVFLGICLSCVPVQAGGTYEEEMQEEGQDVGEQLAVHDPSAYMTLPDPHADMGLAPLQNMYYGERVFCRPLFPGDHVALRSVFCEPQVMYFFGPGIAYTTDHLECCTAVLAGDNVKQAYVWTDNPVFQDTSKCTEAFAYEVALEKKALARGLSLAAYQEQRRQETTPWFHWSVFMHNGSLKKPVEGMRPENCVIVGLASYEEPAAGMPHRECYIGLRREAQNLGIASELGADMLNLVGGTFYVTAHPDNHAAQNVIRRLGFQRAPQWDRDSEEYQEKRLAFLRKDPEELTEEEWTDIRKAQKFGGKRDVQGIECEKSL